MRKLIFVVLAAAAAGCDPGVNTAPVLPPWVLPKEFFQSDRGWYFLKTLFELPPNLVESGDVANFPTPIMPTAKIRFELTENYLVAHRLHPGTTADADTQGLPLTDEIEFALPVKHVDIFANQVADSPYRLWYDRSHVVVDWTAPVTEGKRYVDLLPEMLDFDRSMVTDPSDPDRVSFRDGAIDVVVRVTVRYQYLEGHGVDQEFWCRDRENPNCTGTRASYRLSFRRVEPSPFKPVATSNWMALRMFPFFRFGSEHYSDQYGYTNWARTAYAQQFNVWARTVDDAGQPVPTYDRPLLSRPVYLTPNWPPELIPEVDRALEQWSGAIRQAIVARRRIDCEKAGRAACTGETLADWSHFVRCPNNPVRAGDPELCGPEGTTVRMGDITHVLLDWYENIATSAPMAYAYLNPDRDTGELLGGLVSFNAGLVDRGTMTIVDAVRLLNGDAKFRADYASGEATWKWVEDRRLAGDTAIDYGDALSAEYEKPATTGSIPPPAAVMSRQTLDDRLKRPDFSWLYDPERASGLPQLRTERLEERLAPALERLAVWGQTGASRREPLQGGALEKALVTEGTLRRFGLPPGSTPSEADMELLSPLRSGAWWRRPSQPDDSFAFDSFFFDPDVSVIAPKYVGLSPQALFTELRKEQVYFLLTHELGHLVGLRHNFAGSFDAFNYYRDYWRLRSDGQLGPRFSDPLAAAERAERIERYSHSSVMDYLPNYNFGAEGIGRFDLAAIKWAYGQVVEVMDGAKNLANASFLNGLTLNNLAMASPPPLVAAPDGSKLALHYTDFPRFFDLDRRADVALEDLKNVYGNPEIVPGSGATALADGRVLAPYMGCTDDLSGRLGCQREDLGADPYEILMNGIERERGYYLYTHFARGLQGFPELRRTRINSQMSGIIQDIANASTFIHLAVNDERFFAPGEGLETVNQALVSAMDYLGEQLTMPDVGSYSLQTLPDGKLLYRRGGSADVNLDYDVGRYYTQTSYAQTEHSGLVVPDILRLGFSDDKQSAIDLIARGGSLNEVSLGLSPSNDPRRTLANYYRFFPSQINNLFGSVLTEDYDRFAPVWDGTKLIRPAVSDLGWDPGVLPRVDPRIPLSLKLRIVTVGYPSLFAASQTASFSDLARIWIAGTGTQLTTSQKVSYVDTLSGKTYEALSFLGSQGEETGIGARILNRAKVLLARSLSAPTSAERDAARLALTDFRYLIEQARVQMDTVERNAE